MKKFVTLLVTLLVIASLSFCAVAEEKPFAGQTLTISTFSFNAELLQKNVYDPFEAATGAKLVVDTGRNPERVTKIVESPKDYDVVIIGDMFVDQLRKAGVLETFDSSKLSNISGIYENARAPMGEGYGPAYTFNRLGIVYDSAFCDVEIKSIADLWNPELAGSIAVPEMTTTSGPLFYYATAAAFGLEHDGKPDLISELASLVNSHGSLGAGNNGDAQLAGHLAALNLVAEQVHGLLGGADEDNAVVPAEGREAAVLGSEAPAGMDAHHAAALGKLHDTLDVKIGTRVGAQKKQFLRGRGGGCRFVDISGRHSGYGVKALPDGTADAAGRNTAVGNQYDLAL